MKNDFFKIKQLFLVIIDFFFAITLYSLYLVAKSQRVAPPFFSDGVTL